MIDGVMLKNLVTHNDERGFFREIIRYNDDFFESSFGQLSHSLVKTGVLKAWHGHKEQTQWNYVLSGCIHVALFDNRSGSSTFGKLMEFCSGDDQAPMVYVFPPGVLHGYKCINGPMNIIYVTSGTYDLADEIREPVDFIKLKWTGKMQA